MNVVATAGHVDHGKSSLVKALTGMEPDRWQVERDRGMSIDLGFAWTTLPSGATVAFVDVPGHERFVGNALAGLAPSGAVLLVVAADEGWMPQTREHVAAADALGIRDGVLAINRCDLADAAAVLDEGARELAGTSLAQLTARAVTVSARTGAGLAELRLRLDAMVAGRAAGSRSRPARLWLDRVFTIRGAGTVATGTLVSGRVAVGDRLLVPRTGDEVAIRALQCLGQPVGRAGAVARVAVNLRKVPTDRLRRGDALVQPGAWAGSVTLDIRHRSATRLPREVVVHIGTAALAAAVRPLGVDMARLRLPEPLAVHVGDRLVVRDPGSRRLCGATVLDPAPPAFKGRGSARHRAELLAGHDGLPDGRAELRRRGIVTGAVLATIGVDPPGPPLVGDWHVDPELAQRLGMRLRRLVMDASAWTPRGATAGPRDGDCGPVEPGRRYDDGGPVELARRYDDGVPVELARRHLDLPDARLVAALAPDDLEVTRGLLRWRAVAGEVSPWLTEVRDTLAAAPFAAPSGRRLAGLGATPARLGSAVATGQLIRVGDGYLLPEALPAAIDILAGLDQPFTSSQARQALGTTRRVAIPLLELLDAAGLTVRLAGGGRIIRAPGGGGGGRESNPPAPPREAHRF